MPYNSYNFSVFNYSYGKQYEKNEFKQRLLEFSKKNILVLNRSIEKDFILRNEEADIQTVFRYLSVEDPAEKTVKVEVVFSRLFPEDEGLSLAIPADILLPYQEEEGLAQAGDIVFPVSAADDRYGFTTRSYRFIGKVKLKNSSSYYGETIIMDLVFCSSPRGRNVNIEVDSNLFYPVRNIQKEFEIINKEHTRKMDSVVLTSEFLYQVNLDAFHEVSKNRFLPGVLYTAPIENLKFKEDGSIVVLINGETIETPHTHLFGVCNLEESMKGSFKLCEV